jgi:hypothetical protein
VLGVDVGWGVDVGAVVAVGSGVFVAGAVVLVGGTDVLVGVAVGSDELHATATTAITAIAVSNQRISRIRFIRKASQYVNQGFGRAPPVGAGLPCPGSGPAASAVHIRD